MPRPTYFLVADEIRNDALRADWPIPILEVLQQPEIEIPAAPLSRVYLRECSQRGISAAGRGPPVLFSGRCPVRNGSARS
jgi:hypothetical protein